MVVSVMLLAFSIGHIMQTVLAPDTELAVRDMAPSSLPSVTEGGRAPGLPVPPAATLTPFRAPDVAPSDRITDDPPLPDIPVEDALLVPLGAPCRTTVDAISGDAGLIWLDVSAPCLAGQHVRISHGGIDVDWRLASEGLLSIDFPAMMRDAIVKVRFGDGTLDTGMIKMPDAAKLFRAALVWNGPQVLGLHALEGGAAYGDAGHIHAGAPGRPEGEAGYLLRLGDGSGSMAEVYTRKAARQDVLRLSAEAEVTSLTCDRQTTVTAVQSDGVRGTLVRDASLSMPGCDALGEFVSLNSLFRGLELASR